MTHHYPPTPHSPRSRPLTIDLAADAIASFTKAPTLEDLRSAFGKIDVGVHLAILRPPYLDWILEGSKTAESRFMKRRVVPYQSVNAGDLLILKDSSGPIRGLALVSEARHYGPLNRTDVVSLFLKYGRELRVNDQFRKSKEAARFASLLLLAYARTIPPIQLRKSDRRGWVVLVRSEQARSDLFGGKVHILPRSLNPALSPRTVEVARRPYHLIPKPIVLGDLDGALSAVRLNEWRNDWWTKPFDTLALRLQRARTPNDIVHLVSKRLTSSLSTMYAFKGRMQPFRDGTQTPFTGNVIFYAQHGLALCCRKCVEDWYGIPNGRPLRKEELAFFTQLVLEYLHIRGTG